MKKQLDEKAVLHLSDDESEHLYLDGQAVHHLTLTN